MLSKFFKDENLIERVELEKFNELLSQGAQGLMRQQSDKTPTLIYK